MRRSSLQEKHEIELCNYNMLLFEKLELSTLCVEPRSKQNRNPSGLQIQNGLKIAKKDGILLKEAFIVKT